MELIRFFETYSSNTCAGSGNQLWFSSTEVCTGRVFYRIEAGGTYNYSFLFSNILDSTYSNGARSHKNLICDGWHIHGARVGRCKSMTANDVTQMTVADEAENRAADIVVSELKTLTFDGRKDKAVAPGEFFCSDPIGLTFEAHEYLCLELTYSGSCIPYHEETLLPVFTRHEGVWQYDKHVPFAGMIGCDRRVKERVAYLGDSITQGIGTAANSYSHWNAVLSEKLGTEYAFWNLGLGYGRAEDAASDGAWLYKAKKNQTVFVCYGVNDILQGRAEDSIKSDLAHIVDVLKQNGLRVVLQTVPPFDYTGDNVQKWERINAFIVSELAPRVDVLFDNVPILGNSDTPSAARFGGHPNAQGCRAWAEALYEAVRPLFEEI